MKTIIKIAFALLALSMASVGLRGQTITANAGGAIIGSSATKIDGLQDIAFHFKADKTSRTEDRTDVTKLSNDDDNYDSPEPWIYNYTNISRLPVGFDMAPLYSSVSIDGWGMAGYPVGYFFAHHYTNVKPTHHKVSLVASQPVPHPIKVTTLKRQLKIVSNLQNPPLGFAAGLR
jgi:hypothetical protein